MFDMGTILDTGSNVIKNQIIAKESNLDFLNSARPRTMQAMTNDTENKAAGVKKEYKK